MKQNEINYAAYTTPEYWTAVPGSEKYQVSNYGNFRRKLKTGKYRPLTNYKRGRNQWLAVKVDFNGKYGEYFVHRIVGEVFLDPPPKPSMVLYHKNTFVQDNYAGNLEWIERKELGKITAKMANKSIAVAKTDKDGKIIQVYRSMAQAAKYNYMSRETVRLAVNSGRMSCGFIWKKINDSVEEDL